MRKKDKILVLDSNMISKTIENTLIENGYENVVLASKCDVDLLDYSSTFDYYKTINPDYVFCFAGPHGGITANIEHSAEFIYENLTIQNNIIHGAYLSKVKRLLFMTGACVYPKDCPQPMREETFMSGKMEQTSIAYSTAKVAGIEMCLAYNKQYNTEFIPVILCNNYGPFDDFSESGHVLASMLRKFHEAKQNGVRKVELYGTGKPLREFMYSQDLAQAAICIMKNLKKPELINIGGGTEVSIKELAEIIKKCVGFIGDISFDISKPDGTMRKLCNGDKLLQLGFETKIGFEEGINKTYKWFLDNI